ncbi:MAG TPA: hypothetical protein VH475_19555 [Tepidisphaeraceae bacterium]
MARRGASLDELFERPNRPGTAFAPRISPLRRWGMIAVLFLLVGVICTYMILTDSRRVRAMAESYLSQLTGGHVEVRNATLSIFEGLRLDGVTVRVDDRKRPDSILFKAETFLIKYNPQSMLSGRLEATQIVALDPQVFLCEDLDKGRWNWQRAAQNERTTTRTAPGPRMKFPEVLLRNAQITYSRIRGGRLLTDHGLMEIEGSLKPMEDGTFAFTVQSRGGAGEADAIGPVIKGQFNAGTRVIAASLENFRFGKDIEVMLPQQVRQWWVQHGLSGNLDIPKFYVKPARNGEKMKFRIETDLRNVNLDIQPDEWLSREEGTRLEAMRESVAFMKSLGLDAHGFVSHVENLFNPSIVELDKVAGRFVFTEDGIDIDRVSGWIEKNPFHISGRIDGYSPQSAASITLEGDDITIPHSPRYVNSMPPAFRELYDHLRPEGDGALSVKIVRPSPGAKPLVSGRIDIGNGQFVFDEFAYPLRNVKGAITFGWDDKDQMDRVQVSLHGLGIADGPNANVPVDVKGFVGPLGHGEAEFDFTVRTSGVSSEPALMAAYPPPVRKALAMFDAPGKGQFPQYRGGFVARVHRPPGPGQKFGVVVDVDLDDAKGALTFFPYPVEHLAGRLHITEDHVDLIDLTMKKGDASLAVDGAVQFGKDKPIDPRIRVRARGVPIDKDLLAALPPERRAWLEKIGIGGRLDVEGVIRRAMGSGQPAVGGNGPGDDIGYDLELKLKDGTLWPVEGRKFAATNVNGAMRLTPTQLVVTEMQGRRGAGQISGKGLVDWSAGGAPRITIDAAARNLLLDAALYKLLPPAWQKGWDQAKPDGTVDLELTYRGQPGGGGGATTMPTTQPAAGDFAMTIRPVKLTMTPRVIPCRLDNVKGELEIRPDLITLKEITATRRSGGGTVAYSGTVPTGDRKDGVWDLKLSVKDAAIDKELRGALPPAVTHLIESLKLTGKLTADFNKLTYRADPDPAVEDGQLDIAGTIAVAGNGFDLGVPVTDATGTVTIAAAARRGKLAGLTGTVDLSSMKLGDREIRNARCELAKPESADALRVGKISAEVAGGALAGQVDLVFPDKGASRFGIGLVLRNADVATLAGEKDIKGQVTASLAIEGDWGDPNTRRGRGDVSVSGKEMYRIPLLLGLMQVTNLTLPISSPFNEGAARYSVDGQKVNFEQIELRASNMLMSGSGWLDFASKKVKLTFVTDNPNAWRIPFISDILQGARQELMQIHVTGTVQEPRVSNSMMTTFTTTVDEVFNNDRNGKKGAAGHK